MYADNVHSHTHLGVYSRLDVHLHIEDIASNTISKKGKQISNFHSSTFNIALWSETPCNFFPVMHCKKKKGLLNDSTGSSVLDADMNTRQTLYLTVFLHTLQEVQWRYSRPSPLKQLLKKHNKTKTIVASHDIIITNAVTEQTQQYVNN